MRVLITTPDLNGPGGVAHYYRAVLPKLPQSVESLVIGTDYSAVRRLPGPVRLILDIIAFTKRVGRYDLIHLNPSLCARCFFRELILLSIAKIARRRVLIFFRGWDKGFERKVDRHWKWLFRLGYCKADAIVVLAAEFEDVIRRWGYKGPVFRETTTVDEQMLQGFDPLARICSGETFNVLFLARVEKDKGVYEAVDAVAKLATSRVKFLIGGDGGEKVRLEQYVAEKKYNGIEVCGYVRGDQKITAYQKADVFLFPSYYGEGMPNSVLEAMAFGLPVITCPTGGLKDFFEDGKMGFLVPSRDVKAIVAAIKQLKDEPGLWVQISRFNAEYAREHFYSSRVAIRLQRIYEQTMGGGEKS
jgi:glycosyltransferase involved in cell wall biosynthesis